MAKRLGLVAAFSGLSAAFLLEAIPKINEVRRIKKMSTFRRMAKRLGLVAAFSGLSAAFLLEAIPKINEVRRIKVSCIIIPDLICACPDCSV
ncbi:hypothetical protein AHF37_08132 [Paragonimus kellicotti]|nr:hypothetical protein AHF37_08132 [Paragonimus kellicotti]